MNDSVLKHTNVGTNSAPTKAVLSPPLFPAQICAFFKRVSSGSIHGLQKEKKPTQTCYIKQHRNALPAVLPVFCFLLQSSSSSKMLRAGFRFLTSKKQARGDVTSFVSPELQQQARYPENKQPRLIFRLTYY